MEFVGLDNFRDLFNDQLYLKSFKVTAVFSVLVAGLGLVVSLVLAAFADRVIRGAAVYKTLLIWPYAVAPAIAGVLWMFLFNPTLGIVAHWLQPGRRRLELPALRQSGDAARRDRRGLEADQLQLPVLPRRPAVDPEVAASRPPRSTAPGPFKRFATIVFPLLSPTTFFLLVVNIVYAFFDTFGIIDTVTSGGPGQATEILVFKVFKDGFKALDLGGSSAQSVVLMLIVITLTVVQFRYVERKVQY